MERCELHPPVISDFDGVITDLEGTLKNYIEAYTESLAQETGIPAPKLQDEINSILEKISSNPAIYGWEVDGIIVAPASADPLVAHTVTVQMALSKFNIEVPLKKRTDFYFEHYQKIETHFKEDAASYIRNLRENRKFVFVTNSETDAIARHLTALLGENTEGIEIIGQARKYIVADEWKFTPLVPQISQPEGFPKPVYLWRADYQNALQKGLSGEEGIVVGDIYELDLALPEALGLKTVLLTSNLTPPWEKEYYSKNGASKFQSSSLAEITNWILNSD